MCVRPCRATEQLRPFAIGHPRSIAPVTSVVAIALGCIIRPGRWAVFTRGQQHRQTGQREQVREQPSSIYHCIFLEPITSTPSGQCSRRRPSVTGPTTGARSRSFFMDAARISSPTSMANWHLESRSDSQINDGPKKNADHDYGH